MKLKKTASGYKLTKEAWIEIGSSAGWVVTAMGLEGSIQSFVKKVKSPKTGKEFYTLQLYGNTKPVSHILGKPRKGQKKAGEKLYFSYFNGMWGRIIPDGFIQKVLTGQEPEDPKEQTKVANFQKSIDRLQQGFDVEGQTIKADLSPLFDPASYGDEVQSVEQTQTTGVQKEIQEGVKGGKAAQKLEVLERFIEAEISRISKMTDEAKQSAFVKSFLAFAAKFYNYSFGNQILIWIQKPNATMVSNRTDWRRKFGREVVDYGDPITVRVPFFTKAKPEQIEKWKAKGLSDAEIDRRSRGVRFGAGPVYDISATKPIPGWTDENGNGPYEPVDWRQDSNETVEEIEVLVNAAAKWGEQMGIDVGYEQMEGSLGGYSAGGTIKVNDKYEGINKFSTMVHELAHEALHWEQGKGKGVRNQMGKTEGRMAKEIDAETTAFIVLQHYGFETVDTPNYLALWKATGEDIGARRKNISESVRLIIRGIDDEVRNIELSADQIDEIMEEKVDEHGVDMEKERTEESEQAEEEMQQEAPDATETVEEEEDVVASRDEILRIAKKFEENKKTNLIGNFFGKLGLND
jgi:hypothetical protein